MRNIVRIPALFGVALVATVFFAPQASSQGAKIGFVNDEEIKLRYKAWQRAQEQWTIERKAWDDEALAKKTELDEMISDYEKQKLILSEEKRTEREAAIRTKQESLDAFTRQIYSPGGTAERKLEELTGPLLQNVTDAIKSVAVEENYDVILTLNGVGYIRETLDITEKVLDALEKIGE